MHAVAFGSGSTLPTPPELYDTAPESTERSETETRGRAHVVDSDFVFVDTCVCVCRFARGSPNSTRLSREKYNKRNVEKQACAGPPRPDQGVASASCRVTALLYSR